MELDEIRTQKRTRVNKNRNQAQLGQKSEDQYQEDDDDDGEISKNSLTSFHSSRIFRVSRASGGKDRHSKVLTAKGLRDRRVRLSVSTAIQFYDLQDRLGYDQPSKAIEWLINAASDSINELPPLDGAFVDAVKNPVEKRAEMETTYNYIPLNKSSCSSPSETSKGSVLSLSRSEMRVKARERAKNATKEKEKEKENESLLAHRSNTHGSFTELLIIGTNDHDHNNNDSSSFVHKLMRNDYFNQGGFEHPSSKLSNSSGFHHPTQNIVNTPLYPVMAPFCDANAGEQQELQQFFSISDPLIPSTAALGDYNLNFSISPRIAAYNRGTLQSNSPSPLTHLQRLSSSVDMHNVPFLVGATTSSAMSGGENHFPSGFDGRLQLYYDDGCRISDLKDKGKN